MKTEFETEYEKFQISGFDVKTIPEDQYFNFLRQYLIDIIGLQNDELHDYDQPLAKILNLAYAGQAKIWDLKKEVQKYRNETIEVKKELSKLRRGK